MRKFVVAELLDGDGRDLSVKTPLREWGILTSLGMMRLAQFLQEEFGIQLSPDEIREEHFRDIESIARFVDRNAL